MSYADAICEADFYDRRDRDYEPEPERSEDEEDSMSEVTHQECGGTVRFERRPVDHPAQATLVNGLWTRPDDPTRTVLVCQRCQAVITSTNELHPQGAVCGADLAIGERRSARDRRTAVCA